jgi:4-carboxymuconolactone decarboxylase
MTRYLLAFLLPLALCAGVQAQERMAPIPAEKRTDAQKKAADEYMAARGPMTGPWHVLLRSPELVNRVRGVSDYLRFNSALPPKLSEFIVLITARHWAQQYVWTAHYEPALKGGLNPAVANAVAEGRRPQGMAEDEAIVYDFCTELHRNHSVSDATYGRALAKFGERGIVDMIGLNGHYTMISMMLNTARTPIQAGATPALAPFRW